MLTVDNYAKIRLAYRDGLPLRERCLRQAAESPPTYLVFLSASFCSAVSRPLTFSATLPQSPGSRPSLK